MRELVNSRQQPSQHITARRQADGQFTGRIRSILPKSATVVNTGLRIFNAVKRQAIPMPFERPMGPLVDKLLGCWMAHRNRPGRFGPIVDDGREGRRAPADQIDGVIRPVTVFHARPRIPFRDQWLQQISDRDTVHLSHAALMYRQRDQFLLFDPWLLPWFCGIECAESLGVVIAGNRRHDFPDARP